MAELANSDYAALSLEQRLEVLNTLLGAALEGPSLRADLDARLEECARVRRTMAEENRVGSICACSSGNFGSHCAGLQFCIV